MSHPPTYLPPDLRPLAYQALCTPLVTAYESLVVLSDAIQERGLEVPWFGRAEEPQPRHPLEAARQWAFAEFRPSLLEAEGLHAVEVVSLEIRVAHAKQHLVCLYRTLTTNRVHAYLIKMGQWNAEGWYVPDHYGAHDSLLRCIIVDRAIDDARLKKVRWLEIRKYATKSGKDFWAHTWHFDRPAPAERCPARYNENRSCTLEAGHAGTHVSALD